jgi:hypothetical protein
MSSQEFPILDRDLLTRIDFPRRIDACALVAAVRRSDGRMV